MSNIRIYSALLLASAAVPTLAAPAFAQAVSPETSVDAKGSEAIDDIVVTAQRRPEPLQTVPVSVTALSADTLKTRGLNTLAQIALAAPSLQAGTDNNFAVRGVGTAAFASTIESSVAFAEDEVNLTNPGLISDFFDVAQVEVLNGPQGLLFGRNASAGLLNVATARPKLGVLGASFDLEGDLRDTAPGNSKGAIARVNLNVPLGNNAAARFSGFYNYQQPLVDHVGATSNRTELDQRRYAFRGKLLFEPSDALSFYLIGNYGEEHGVLGSFDTTFRTLGAGSINVAPLAAVGIVPGPENLVLSGEGGYFRDIKRGGVQLKIAYRFANGMELSNIAAWRGFDRTQQLDGDGTQLDGASRNFSAQTFDQYSNELRLALPADARLSGQVGLYAFNSTLDASGQIAGNNYLPPFLLPQFPFCVGATVVPGPPPNCSVSNNYFLGRDSQFHLVTKSYAAFGQLTYKITDQFKALAGGRVTHDDIKIDLIQNADRYFVPLGIPFNGSRAYDNTNFSWKVGAQYDISPTAMVYATYGHGYKGPGFNDNPVTTTGSLLVRPETNKNIELGVKSSWFSRKLVFNVALFKSDFSDYQAQSFDLTTSSFIIQNAAELNTKGAEFTVIARPVPGLTLNGSATLLDSKFGNFPGAQCYPTQGCTTFNAAGRRPPLAPEFSATAQARYEFQTSGDTKPFIEANIYHRSSVNFTIQPAPLARDGAADILGGSIGVHGKNWQAFLFCKNCTDQRVPVSIAIDAGDANSGVTTYIQRFGLGSFRTLGLSFGFDF